MQADDDELSVPPGQKSGCMRRLSFWVESIEELGLRSRPRFRACPASVSVEIGNDFRAGAING